MCVLKSLLLFALLSAGYSYNCTHTQEGHLLCHLLATEDVFIYNSLNQNHFDFLIVGLHPRYPLKRSLLKFEDIPPTCNVILQANMYVHYWYAHKASFLSESEVPWIPRPIEARQILKSWRENEATRFKRLVNSQWNLPYMDLNDIDARSDIDDIRTISRNTSRGFISWNVTKTAANWLAGQPNNGIVLSAQNEDVQGREIRFYSRERALSLRPYLEVLCDDGNGGTGEL